MLQCETIDMIPNHQERVEEDRRQRISTSQYNILQRLDITVCVGVIGEEIDEGKSYSGTRTLGPLTDEVMFD